MCLNLDIHKTNELKKKHKSGFITVYKFLDKVEYNLNHALVSPFRGQFEYKVGMNVSNRPVNKLSDSEMIGAGQIKGFHTFINKSSANEMKFPNEIVVEFKALWKDFVAAGDWGGTNYIFRRLYLSQKEWNRIFKIK
jgi:hypothetical protein